MDALKKRSAMTELVPSFQRTRQRLSNLSCDKKGDLTKTCIVVMWAVLWREGFELLRGHFRGL